jgi:hypothetical protein
VREEDGVDSIGVNVIRVSNEEGNRKLALSQMRWRAGGTRERKRSEVNIISELSVGEEGGW